MTGSIGRQALEVAARLDLPVAAIAAGRGSDSLLEVAGTLPDSAVVVAAPTPGEREVCLEALGARVSFGAGALTEAASLPGTTVVNGTIDRFLDRDRPVVFYGVTSAGPARVLNLNRFCVKGH